MTLEERVEKLERVINHLQSRVNDLDGRTIGQVRVGPGCISPPVENQDIYFARQQEKDAKSS